jgi:choline dehydrogenase-like flavoprotein
MTARLQFLSQREWETVRAFADVFIEGPREAISPDDVASNVDAQLARMKSKRLRSLKTLLWVIEFVLPVFLLQPRFSRATRDRRRRMIDKHITNPRGGRLQRDLAKIRTLFLTGYYGDKQVRRSIPFEEVHNRGRFPTPPIALEVEEPRIQPPQPGETEIRCDLCVVGSGAGGGVVAARAVEAGLNVVLLEEGPYVRPGDLSHEENRMSAMLYKESGLQTTVDFDMSILQGKCLGGTTVINNCICFRLNDSALYNPTGHDTLVEWRKLSAAIDSHELERSYQAVSARIGVAPLDPSADGTNGSIFREGWEKLKAAGLADPDMTTGTFQKNYNQCLGCGYCNFGCRYARKASMLETFVIDASKANARIITGCLATRVVKERKRATGVECELADGRILTIRANKTVLACGAIGSSVLLLKSGITKNVGSRFSFNAATIMFAMFPEPIRAYDGVQMSSFVDGGEFLIETNFSPPMATSAALPGWFEVHFERMRRFDRLASAGVVIGTRNNGRVKRLAFLRDTFGPVKYEMVDDDLAAMRRGVSLLAQIYFAAGAEAVLPATFVDSEMRASEFAPGGVVDDAKISEALTHRIRKPDDLTLNSSHPQGGNPMSDDPKTGVVDSRFRVHGFENLFVADASVFPTTIRVNPQLTIMAMADYAWRTGIQ